MTLLEALRGLKTERYKKSFQAGARANHDYRDKDPEKLGGEPMDIYHTRYCRTNHTTKGSPTGLAWLDGWLNSGITAETFLDRRINGG